VEPEIDRVLEKQDPRHDACRVTQPLVYGSSDNHTQHFRARCKIGLDPAHIARQLAQYPVWPAVEFELEHEEVTRVVNREDIDRPDGSRILSPGTARRVSIETEAGAAHENA
jgi:hypothetical protein